MVHLVTKWGIGGVEDEKSEHIIIPLIIDKDSVSFRKFKRREEIKSHLNSGLFVHVRAWSLVLHKISCLGFNVLFLAA